MYFPRREQVWTVEDGDGGWVEAGNTVIVGPGGDMFAGPAREEETMLTADIDLATVRAARRFFDPVGHDNRPDVFHLSVDTRARVAVTVATDRPVADPIDVRDA